jgi:hypothetical protein
MHLPARRPSEHEEPHREEERGVNGGHEPLFLWGQPVLHDGRVDHEKQVREVSRVAEDGAHDDGEEREAQLALVEAVDIDVDEREGFEEGVAG